MEALRDSTAVTDTVSSTIPGPYINSERTESIPLKGSSSTPSSNIFSRCCQKCIGFTDDDAGDGLKFIVVTFFILSVAVTVALVAQIYHGDFQVVPHGSVATDNIECSKIGTNILKKNGNAVDAAVASTLCMGVVNPHITGLGGGGFMLVYDHRRKDVVESLDFREAAPKSLNVLSRESTGPTAVGVPGLLSGLFAAHKAHGKLSWQEVVKPAVDIARSGFLVTSSLVAARALLPPRSDSNAMLHDLVDTLQAGQTLKLPSLAATLELIANEGPDGRYYPATESWWWMSLICLLFLWDWDSSLLDSLCPEAIRAGHLKDSLKLDLLPSKQLYIVRTLGLDSCYCFNNGNLLPDHTERIILVEDISFYNGSIAKEILDATQGSTLTATDLSTYRPVPREALHENFYGFDIIVPGAPSGGPLLLAALKSIYALNLTNIVVEESTPLLLLKQAQAIQQNYAAFLAESGDPNFSSISSSGSVPSSIPETVASHVAAVDLNDLYVSVVSGHNSLFGSLVLTKGGFVLNNALASFDSSSSFTEKPVISGHSLSNAYSLPGDTNGTITLNRAANPSDESILLDHHTPSATVPYLDSSSAQVWQGKEASGEKSSSDLLSESTRLLRRNRRFETSELGPKTTVWGSSVANNGVAGGKRPISIATPVIAVERGKICGRRLVLGGSDASIAAQVLSQLLVLDGNITSSIEFPRVRLGPSGSGLSLEQSYAARLNPTRRQQLADLGLQMQPPTALNPSVNIIEKTGDVLTSRSDSRGEGVASRF